jgi:Putative prokaryotic signal transducing protein
MPGKLGDQLDIRSRPVEDDAVDMGHVLLDKRNERRETGSWIIRARELNHDSQRICPPFQRPRYRYCRRSTAKVKAIRQEGDVDRAMKELLRSNDPVLLSYVSALLEQESIDFIVADLNMSVLEGSIGALPQRVLVESDKITQARQILTGAGIGHVIADDGKT